MNKKLLQIGVATTLLSFLLFSPAFAIIINGVPYGQGSVTNPNQYYTTTVTATGTTPYYNITGGADTTSGATAGGSAVASLTPEYVNGRWSEGTLQTYAGIYGVRVDSGANIYGLGNFAITGVVALKKTVDYYTLAVRGTDLPLFDLHILRGTETFGIDSPSLDVASDDNLDYFIRHMATDRRSGLYQLGDDYFFDNDGSWHIVFGPSNGTFVKNSINFFGMVRDNFNVPHPTITDANVPASVNFNRNLTIGSSGQDVNDLQKLLNTDPYTVVATTGDGSAGRESRYYGNLSKGAVVRWQYKYNEILDAAGITTPTGFFGPFTRASMTSYWNYLNALKHSPNQAALQYPTPTKPLEDVPLNANVTPTGNPASGATSTPEVTPPNIISDTPNAPNYLGYDQDPGNNWNLNPVISFNDPNPFSFTSFNDPSDRRNIANAPGNTPTNSSPAGGGSSPFSSIGQILAGLGGLTGQNSGGGLFGGLLGGGGLRFGGKAITTTAIKCTCPESLLKGNFTEESNSAYPRQGPINLWLPIEQLRLPPAGSACIFGNYRPLAPGEALQLCKMLNPQTGECEPSPFATQLKGYVTFVQPTGAGFQASACH